MWIWPLILGTAGAATLETDNLKSVFVKSFTDQVIAVADSSDKLQVSVAARDVQSMGKVMTLGKSDGDVLPFLARQMLKNDVGCGILVDKQPSGTWLVKTLGDCGVESDAAHVPDPPPEADVPPTVRVEGETEGVRSGWTDAPERILRASVDQLGEAGAYVVAEGSGVDETIVEAVTRGTGHLRGPVSEDGARPALAAAVSGMERMDAACGIVLDRGDALPRWRVLLVGDCPRGQLRDEVDLQIEAATGEERERLVAEAETEERTRSAEAAEAAAKVRARLPYHVPTSIDVSEHPPASLSFGGVAIEVDQSIYDLSALPERNVTNGLAVAAGYAVDPDAPRFIVDGAVVELGRWQAGPLPGIMLGVDWAVRDSESQRTLYRVRTRSWLSDMFDGGAEARLEELLARAVVSLLSRKELVKRLRKASNGSPAGRLWEGEVTLRRCKTEAMPMPKSARSVLGATLALKTPDAIGSAVVISPDGWAVTAAHVVGSATSVELLRSDGSEGTARVVRAEPDLDVALLHLPDRGTACLVPTEPPDIGHDVFALGSPKGLDFSMSRGIVSAVRQGRTIPEIQTDASISPGNSGGPLVDASGRAVGIVVSKAVGGGVEGVGFARHILPLLDGLQVSFGDATNAEPDLMHASWTEAVEHLVEEPDPMPGADWDTE